MNSKTPTEASQGPSPATSSASDILPLIADDRRRYVLHYLSNKVGRVSLGELAEQLALWEDNPTYDQYERILTSLHHFHLPKLVDGGLVQYNPEQEAVNGLDTIDAARPYLDLALEDDLREE